MGGLERGPRKRTGKSGILDRAKLTRIALIKESHKATWLSSHEKCRVIKRSCTNIGFQVFTMD